MAGIKSMDLGGSCASLGSTNEVHPFSFTLYRDFGLNKGSVRYTFEPKTEKLHCVEVAAGEGDPVSPTRYLAVEAPSRWWSVVNVAKCLSIVLEKSVFEWLMSHHYEQGTPDYFAAIQELFQFTSDVFREEIVLFAEGLGFKISTIYSEHTGDFLIIVYKALDDNTEVYQFEVQPLKVLMDCYKNWRKVTLEKIESSSHILGNISHIKF